MPRARKAPIAPGATVGILGSGQLGRMIALDAARLGYRSHVFGPGADDPAMQVTNRATAAAYDDEAALAAFAAACDVITYEFENVPYATAAFLADRALVRPGPKVLQICQDRLREKDFCNSIGAPTTRYVEVGGPEAVARELRELGAPAILKSAVMGYDGKGQVLVKADSDPKAAWEQMAGHAPDAIGILEALVDFRMEISVIAARGLDGQIMTYVPVENRHRHHILDETLAPARLPPALSDKAEGLARLIAEKLELVGLVAVEMFVTSDDRILINELAPRPHNSGHWTIDACVTSQFEQLVRAVCGLPLGSTQRHADAIMKNLMGDEVSRWLDAVGEPNSKLHLYGKAEPRPGRKMGHVTRLLPKREG
ncbi:5-(carboxyamino)imidazole ribonucleotide synthase [Tistlia consotensis]|uniref:N5-carboxyaminoimidazole ribonucleotide synthase n=1 Tax=Tistlia consotensis USBA 355 TaxID=560819 RepID=A0A1Y6C1Z2_9PROT|nr:5-(carboxyamino)imidazole ribonucleotide synthase [Tistlia consotensis]SMF32442.1 5-(carboxyamino)imidazole ribonucleotide synthase [Tistlia consotensis USBA 355]SNR68484.1 5-(carboxyamino)imidazole ribonucleotide synthase [Tistlia consotensis]